MPGMLPKRFRRRTGTWGTALLLWDIWKRIPPKQRRQIMAQVRRHGPRLAKQAAGRRKRS